VALAGPLQHARAQLRHFKSAEILVAILQTYYLVAHIRRFHADVQVMHLTPRFGSRALR
jgi:hypothetical protein